MYASISELHAEAVRLLARTVGEMRPIEVNALQRALEDHLGHQVAVTLRDDALVDIGCERCGTHWTF